MKKIIFFICLLYLICANAADRPKIGLVLSGGGARGIAHIPTLKLIDSLNIPIDYIAGTSIGGLGGALYAMGYSGAEIEKAVMSVDWDDMFNDLPRRKDLPYVEKKQVSQYQLEFGLNKNLQPELPLGLIEGQKVLLLFSKWTLPFSRVRTFDQLQIPFRCIAVDLVSGNEVVLKDGSLARAMRSTMSIPSIFSPVEWGDSLLIDGGIVNNIPVDVVREMGADIVIAVNVGTPLKKRTALKSVIDIFEQSFNIPGSYREEKNIDLSDILITPNLDFFSSANFDANKLIKIEAAGLAAARKAEPELVRLKNMLDIENDTLRQKQSFQEISSFNPRIFSLQIVGNTRIPFKFIYELLGVTPGKHFNIDDVNESILKLYSLNYFKSIYYEIEELEPGLIKLIFYVKEKPFRRLKIGLRYDDYYRLVIGMSLQGTNILLPGLRTELQLQFPGYNRIFYKNSYPSMTLDQAIYPFLQAELLNRPRDYYDRSGKKTASYEENIFRVGIGLGLLPTNHLNLETDFRYELNQSSSVVALGAAEMKTTVYEISAMLDFDYLDQILVPHQGFRFHVVGEMGMYKLKHKFDFYKLEFGLSNYATFKKRHTVHFRSLHGFSSGDLPFYKEISIGGPDSFVGSRYDQFTRESTTVLHLGYRYRFRKDFYLKFLWNVMFEKNLLYYDFSDRPHFVSGFGFGLKYMSIAGPIQIVFARGEKSFYGSKFQNMAYVTGGYMF